MDIKQRFFTNFVSNFVYRGPDLKLHFPTQTSIFQQKPNQIKTQQSLFSRFLISYNKLS